ncbi:MAG: SDR family NAD(P)-dependent oxidoreductase [Bacteroidetes bacterium]|nr:SDR family NAD(P)-dependent oxidoreductase [Bacteroidota bacterium]MCY4234333.1 SDR family NAD(P)-dependent oxidoreductase [Bacteroidota bacterium]
MAKIIITGASSGIGVSLAEAFFNDGSHEIILIGRSEVRLNSVANSTDSYPLICDLTDAHQVASAAKLITERFQSPPDVLINNAGHFVTKPFMTTTADVFREQFDSNLMSSFLITKELVPSMIRAKSGHVFFMGSVASIKGYPGATAYTAAKHGLIGFARSLRSETLNSGVRVTTILPGATLTPSWDGTTLPEERFMPPEDIAQSVIDCWKLSTRTVVEELLIRPVKGDL